MREEHRVGFELVRGESGETAEVHHSRPEEGIRKDLHVVDLDENGAVTDPGHGRAGPGQGGYALVLACALALSGRRVHRCTTSR